MLRPRAQFIVQGTNGGLQGNSQSLEWKYLKREELPEREVVAGPLVDKDGNPVYCNETLNWYNDRWEISPEASNNLFGYMTEQLYLMLYRTLTSGDALEITPQHVRRQMAVMEECRRQNPHIYKEGYQ